MELFFQSHLKMIGTLLHGASRKRSSPRIREMILARLNPMLALLAGLSMALATSASLAQSRTIKFIVPLSPGGPNDLVARLTAEHIQRNQGVSMVIENRAGAGTVIGTEIVARAVPDGSTILMAAGSFTVNPHIKKLSYDPLTSFEPICYLVRSPHVLVVPASSPYKTLPELLAAAKAKPEEIMFAANGPATSQHIEFEMLRRAANVNMTFVPFTGDAPTLNAALGDQVSAAILDYVTVAEYIKIGKLRAIAVGTQQRIDKLPDTPSMAELGYKDFDWAGTFGVLAPAKTPKDRVDELVRWFSASLKAPEVLAKLDNLGLYPMNQCGADYSAVLRKAYDQNGRVIRESNIKTE